MKQNFTTPELDVVRFPVCINTLTVSDTQDPDNCEEFDFEFCRAFD